MFKLPRVCQERVAELRERVRKLPRDARVRVMSSVLWGGSMLYALEKEEEAKHGNQQA